MPTDLIKTGAAWLSSQLQASASTPVTYCRGGSCVAIRATFGEKLLRLSDGDGGIRMEWTDIDFVFPATGLVLSGDESDPAEPERGDVIRIQELDADEVVIPNTPTRIYEVVPFSSNEPAWRYTDPHRTMIRVHCKFVEVEPGA